MQLREVYFLLLLSTLHAGNRVRRQPASQYLSSTRLTHALCRPSVTDPARGTRAIAPAVSPSHKPSQMPQALWRRAGETSGRSAKEKACLTFSGASAREY